MRLEDQQYAELSSGIVEAAIDQMRDAGVPTHIIVDRLATYSAFAAVQVYGAAHTAAQFRRTADAIDAGLFDGVGTAPAGRG